MKALYLKAFITPMRRVVLSAIYFCIPALASAAPLVQHTTGSTKLVIENKTYRGKPALAIQIQNPKLAGVDVFTLSGPNRIVVDLGHASLKKPGNYPVAESSSVETVRLGSHKDKIRMVVDLRGSTVPEYSWAEGSKSFTLYIRDLAEPKLVQTKKTSPSTASISNKKTDPANLKQVKTTLKPVTVLRLTKIVEREATPSQPSQAKQETAVLLPPLSAPEQSTISPKPVKEPTPDRARLSDHQPEEVLREPENHGPRLAHSLSSIEFGTANNGDTQVLKIGLSSSASFNVAKTGSLEYRLIIADTSLGSRGLALPQFPPQEFEGLTVIQAAPFKDRVEVTIGVERGYRIVASSSGSEIWITAERQRRVA